MDKMPRPQEPDEKVDDRQLGKPLDDLMVAAQKHLEKLERTVTSLPPVDKDGHSPAPHAENFYARKENEVKEVEGIEKDLERNLGWLTRALERCHRRRDIGNQDRARLHDEEIVKKYDLADHDWGVAIERLEAKREAMEELIHEVEEALRLASQRKWPLGEPVERMHFPNPFGNPDVRIEPGPRLPSALVAGPGLPGASPGGASPSLGDGLGGLISNGPAI